MPVKASGSERSRVGFRRRVDTGSSVDKKFNDGEVSGGRSAPQWRGSVDSFAIKNDCNKNDVRMTNVFVQVLSIDVFERC